MIIKRMNILIKLLLKMERFSQVPLIKDVLVQYICVTDRTIACGDHTIILGKVNEIYFCDPTGRPLLFHGGSYVSLDYSH